MHLDRLYRSTAVKLAAIFFGLFLILFLIATAASYLLVSHELTDAVDDRIRAEYTIISAQLDPEDPEKFVENVQNLSDLRDPQLGILLLTDKDGEQLAGNVEAFPVKEGGSSSALPQIKRGDDYAYRLYSRPVGDMQLTVGQSLEDSHELLEITLVNLAWTAGIAICLAVIGAILLSRKVQQRLRPVADTMDRVADGDLTARIPRLKSTDDLDALSGSINDALERLGLLVDGMRQVTTDIAHDLKTPLNRLSIIIEEALQQENAGKTVSSKLEAARWECDNINQTFEALLRIAQIEASARNKSHFTTTDLSSLIETVADIYSDIASDAGMSLNIVPHNGPVFTEGDEKLLVQMLVNLVENAIRHCPEQTAITISVSLENKRPSICVVDNGPGIPKAERENVLRRLYRLEQSRTTSGNGLGLALVKAVADLHGAQIELSDNNPADQEQRGLQVKIAFPAKANQK